MFSSFNGILFSEILLIGLSSFIVGLFDHIQGLMSANVSKGVAELKTEQPSLAEIDELLKDLERVSDMTVTSQSDDTEERYQMYLDFPTDVWQVFLEHCRQNELDPAQQLREAVISYYRNLVEAYRNRRRAAEIDQLK